MRFLFCLLIISISILPASSLAQRNITYQSLLQRADQPKVYISELTLPSDEELVNFSVAFRMDHDFIPFIKVNEDQNLPSTDYQYFSNIRMGLELYSGSHEESSRKKVRNLDPVVRSSWQDTAWAETFQATRSNADFAQGAISVNAKPGEYTYMLQLRRGESVTEQNSRMQNVTLPDYTERNKISLIELSDFVEKEDGSYEGTLLNYGENALYGEDFQLMILNPAKISSDELRIEIYRLLPGEDENVSDEMLFSAELNNQEDIRGTGFTIKPQIESVSLNFDDSDEGYPVSVVSIPNGRFPNSGFKIFLKDVKQDTTIAEKTMGSLWPDIPVSLLNLNIAIDMLRFMVSDKKIEEIKSGSSAEKERKFREFWKERDPTPDTEFNELMTEYYDRIDYAYREFTTPQNPGFETDRGKAYILYGPPNEKERRLPTDAPAREIWYYDNRTLVFEATTGFGDFKLVAEQ